MLETSDLDVRIKEAASKVDWHSLTQEDAVSLGLTLGMVREQKDVQRQRYVAWEAMGSTLIAVCVIATLFGLLGVEGANIVVLVVGFLGGRTLMLAWNEYRARKELAILERLAIDAVDDLANKYPLSTP